MGLKDCRITLNSLNFYPGQTLEGKVDYEFDSPKRIRGIKIEFLGTAETSWTSTSEVTNADGKKESVKTVHRGQEEYFRVQYYLLGSKSGNDIDMPIGNHSYTFSCPLPPTLPSSFEGEYGHVRYTVKSTLDIPWKTDRETILTFNVVGYFDDDDYPKFKAPLNLHIEKNFGCCFCKSAPVKLDVRLPASLFSSRQEIPIEISCENGSSIKIDNVTFKIMKIITYHTSTPQEDTQEVRVKLLKKQVPGFPANSTQNLSETLILPEVPPTNLDKCGIINLKYELDVTMNPSGWHFSRKVTSPVIIGPLGSNGFQAPEPGMGVAENAPLLASAPLPTPPCFPAANMPQYPANANYPAPGYPHPTPGYPQPSPTPPNNGPYPPTANPPYPMPTPAAGWVAPPATGAGYPYPPGTNSPNAGYPYPAANPSYPSAATSPGKVPYPPY